MLNNKTIVIDLDGTLLNDKKEISDIDLKWITNLSINNSIILASGRNYIETINVIKRYNLYDYIIKFIVCSNGQQVYDINNNKIIKNNKLKTSQAIKIANMLDKNNIYWYIISNGNLFCKDIKYNCNKYLHNGRYKINFIKSNKDIKKVNIEKFILNTKTIKDMDNIKTILHINYKVGFFKENRLKRYGEIEYLQNSILPDNTNKYIATEFIIKQLKLSKYIIAFGNGINDYEIMNNADISICMKNSNDTTKEISDFITLSNNENGISYAIEQLIKDTGTIFHNKK